MVGGLPFRKIRLVKAAIAHAIMPILVVRRYFRVACFAAEMQVLVVLCMERLHFLFHFS